MALIRFGLPNGRRYYLPRTFFGRSVIIIVMPLILLQVVSTWIFYDRHWDTVTRRLASAVAGEIQLIITAREHYQNGSVAQELLDSFAKLGLNVRFLEGDTLPAVAPRSGGGILETRLSDALRRQVNRPFRIDTWSLERIVRIKIQLDDSVMRIDLPLKRLFSSTTYIFVMWMVGTSILLIVAATLFMRKEVRPIRRLAHAVDSFGKGRDTPDFRPEGAAEIRLAAVAFDRMRRRIQNMLTQRTEMLAGVSHDLRTPLTRMKLQLEMLEPSTAVEALKGDVQEMQALVEEFLAFSRGEGTEETVDVDAGEIVRTLVATTQEDSSRLSAEIHGDLRIAAKPNALRRCLTNLVTNALTHAHTVRIEVHRRSTLVQFIIDDDGPGIPDEKREAVFQPFYRLDASRNSLTGGTGLGLAIARDIARGHGGDITLGVSPMGGLRAEVAIPV